MGLRERLSMVTQFFEKARSKGHQLREANEAGEPGAPSADEQSTQREARRRSGMTAEDQEWEQAGQQRDRDRQAQSREPTIAADEPRISGDT
jgi:hypothetical protein